MIMAISRTKIEKIWCDRPQAFFDATFYTNPAILSLEIQHIFQRTWIYVGHIQNVIEPGSVWTVEAAGSSILIVRTQNGQLKAYHNVCSHRAAALQSELGIKKAKCLVCPYHGWVFNLEGELTATPGRKNFSETVHTQEFPLSPVRLETWGPLIFICLSKTAPPLTDFLGQEFKQTLSYPLQDMQLIIERETEVACNWKTFHDNSLCDYHVSVAHRETLKDVQGPVQYYRYFFDEYVNLLTTPTTPTWQAESRIYKDLPLPFHSKFLTYGIFPNLHIFMLPDTSLYIERIDPISVNTCRVRTEIYGIPGYSPSADDLNPWYTKLFREDQVLTEGVQRGYESGSYTPGPINYLESRMIQQQQLIRRFLMLSLSQKFKHTT
jgi:phenylpropionate dioxygenase-like ring-hydroxylating dioxygenase large terminal subunit